LADLASIIQSQNNVSKDTDIDSAGLNMQLRYLRNERFRSDTLDRKWLAVWATTVVTLWLIAVILILINKHKFDLSDTVLVTLLGTTTLNILGLSYIVLKGHFKEHNDPL
jgi:hypothetical protein